MLDVYPLETGIMGTQFFQNRIWSFAAKHKKVKTYKDFLDDFSGKQMYELAFKESRPEITDLLKDDIIVPEFYKDVAELQDIEIFHGTHFVDKPHYEKQEQMICAVDGHASFVLIPHVNR